MVLVPEIQVTEYPVLSTPGQNLFRSLCWLFKMFLLHSQQSWTLLPPGLGGLEVLSQPLE